METTATSPSARYVCFEVGAHEVGAPIAQVRETIDLRPITPVFHTPPLVAGLINLRGEILVVLDVGVLLGGRASRRDPRCRIVVVDVEDQGQTRSAGLLVDGLGPIRDSGTHPLTGPPTTLPEDERVYIRGIVSLPSHPLAILDLERIFAAPQLSPFTIQQELDR